MAVELRNFCTSLTFDSPLFVLYHIRGRSGGGRCSSSTSDCHIAWAEGGAPGGPTL